MLNGFRSHTPPASHESISTQTIYSSHMLSIEILPAFMALVSLLDIDGAVDNLGVSQVQHTSHT